MWVCIGTIPSSHPHLYMGIYDPSFPIPQYLGTCTPPLYPNIRWVPAGGERISALAQLQTHMQGFAMPCRQTPHSDLYVRVCMLDMYAVGRVPLSCIAALTM